MSHIKREVIVYAHVGDGSENIVKNVEKQKKRERKKKKKTVTRINGYASPNRYTTRKGIENEGQKNRMICR